MPSVTVNLNVNINAATAVEVFGQSPEQLSNIIQPVMLMPVRTLYNGAGNSLIKFQGVDSQSDPIIATRDSGFTTTESDIANSIQKIIENPIDASLADPYNATELINGSLKGKYNYQYTNPSNIGKLAIGSFAHYYFGHVQATAAITNDSEISSYMTGRTNTDANIANLIAQQLMNLNDTKCKSITRQVIGQDASRAKFRDNDAASPSAYQSLEFKSGDVVYFQIKIQRPSVTSGSGQGYPISDTLYNDITYNVKVILGDNFGECQWATSVTGITPQSAQSIAVDSEGNVYVFGYTNGLTTIKDFASKPSSGSSTINQTTYGTINAAANTGLLIKYSNTGSVMWATTITGINGSIVSPTRASIAMDSSDNIYITATKAAATSVVNSFASNPLDGGEVGVTNAFTLQSSAAGNIILVKYNKNGIAQWTTQVDTNNLTDNGNSVAIDGSDNVILCGYITGNATIYNGDNTVYGILNVNSQLRDVAIIKYNSSGQALWATGISTDSTSKYDYGYAVTCDVSNNIYVTGQLNVSLTTQSSDTTTIFNYNSAPESSSSNVGLSTFGKLYSLDAGSIFVAKYNPSGVAQWVSTIGGTNLNIGNAIKVVENGVCICGTFSGTVTIKGYSGIGGRGGVPADSIGQGTYGTLTADGVSDGILIRYNSTNGVPQAVTKLGGTGATCEAYGMCVDSNKNICITGSFIGTMMVQKSYYTLASNSIILPLSTDPIDNLLTGTFGTLTSLNATTTNCFIVQYSEYLLPMWATIAGTSSFDDRGNSLAVDSQNNIYLAGHYRGSTGYIYDFYKYPETATDSIGLNLFGGLSATGNQEWLIAKFGGATLFNGGVKA